MCIYLRATFDNVGATAAVPRQVRGRTQFSGSLLMAVLLAFACGLVLPLLLSVRVAAQTVPAQSDCGSKAYLDNLPVPPPKDPNVKRQVQLVNCSDQVLLGAANASRAANQPPWPVFPQEGTWVMQPFDKNNPTDYSNVLTIDIPPQWYGQHVGGNTGNFWARTGCRYDPVRNRAQCETGGCGGQYDCSSANISPPPATTIVEWTFYQQFQSFFFDSPDISAVNGASLTVDVSPKGGDDLDPINPKDWHWLNWNYPLTVHGKDLREPTQCVPANGGGFKIARSDIDKTVDPNSQGYPFLGYVTVDGMGNPTMPNGNYLLACLSNCGRYKFPTEVGKTGCNTKTDPNCYFWTTFCAGNDSINYSKKCFTGKCPTGQSGCQDTDKYYCDTDQDCLACNGGTDYHIACFKKDGPDKRGVCELRGFYKGSVGACNGIPDPQPAAPASKVACNNTYGSVNPLDNDDATRFDFNDQPIVAGCSVVTFNGTKAACIGEDTVHQVLHGAYTWPNDPEVFQGDAPVYRIVFSPEGSGQAPITAAQPLPACDSLPTNYKPSQNRSNCSIPIMGQNAEFGIGLVRNQPPNQWQSTGNDWPCFVPERTAADNGIVCEWNPLPEGANCRAPKTDTTYVPNSACGRIDSGTSLVSGTITPKSSGDPLLLEVSIPKVLNNVSLPTSISGCVPTGMGAWTLIASQALKTNQGVIAWYKGTSNTSTACQVTVTLASENPAELKLYDVPKFTGKVDTMSTAAGDYTNQPLPYTVSAGTATTRFSSDLQLGALLMVNRRSAPVTYWDTWLSNGPTNIHCLGNDTNCPREDGPDFLPGHGPNSGSSDVGHNQVTPGPQYFHRDAGVVVNDSNFSWLGLAIYIQLNP